MSIIDKIWHVGLKQPFRLTFADYLGGDIPVVLLHGIASDKTFWHPLAILLQERGHRVIVPDLLGHGDSPTPDYIGYSTDDQARAVIALLNKLRVPACILVGHSMGSLVASRIAKLEQSRINRLLLYEPPLYADIPEFKTHQLRRQFYFNIYERIAANPSKKLSLTRLVAKTSDNWTKYLASDQTWLPIERSLRNSILDQTGYDELKEITIETDIVHGRLDIAVSGAGLRKLLEHNEKVSFHKTTDRHKLSRRSARFLADLIAPQTKIEHNKRRKQRGQR